MRISANDFIEFHETAWPEGYIWTDSSTYIPDGSSEEVDIYDENAPEGETRFVFKADEIFTVPDYWSVSPEVMGLRDEIDMRKLLRAWLKKRTEKTMVVRIPKEKEEEFKAFLKTIDGKIEK